MAPSSNLTARVGRRGLHLVTQASIRAVEYECANIIFDCACWSSCRHGGRSPLSPACALSSQLLAGGRARRIGSKHIFSLAISAITYVRNRHIRMRGCIGLRIVTQDPICAVEYECAGVIFNCAHWPSCAAIGRLFSVAATARNRRSPSI